jgi:thiol-disulfide isomerase/thioredoxin
MTERGRIVFGTASLPLVAAAFCYFAGRGVFVRMSGAPLAFALGFPAVAFLSLVWKPGIYLRLRAALVLLATLFAVGSAIVHRNYLEARYRATEEPARAALVGRVAPKLAFRQAFNLTTEDAATLRAVHGKVVVIDFWATWCEPCARTMPRLQELQSRFPGRLLVVGVTKLYGGDGSSEDPAVELARIKAFADARGVHYPILVADSEENLSNYRVTALPTVVIVDPAGRVSYYWVAERGAQEAIRQIELLLAS